MKSRLQTFNAADQQAFALAGMALLDALNAGALVVTDRAGHERCRRAADLVETLYQVQDAIHGGQHEALKEAVSKLCALQGDCHA